MFKHANEAKAFFNGKVMDGELTSENLGQSPKMAQGFQANKFMKINRNLLIPDTINEHSGELSGNSLQAEVPKIILEVCDSNQTSENSQSRSDESSIASTIVPVGNSFLLDCEKKLLECSISDEERSKLINKSFECDFYGNFSRKLGLFNDTISTPPNELRSHINALRDEIKESDEFHDLEIQILKEDLEENTHTNYLELIEKYGTLMELYTSLKIEYEAYRNEQENFKQEIHSKTANCLESLCSQIEASDGSLSISDASFASFTTDVKSSTMVGNYTEREITLLNNSTLTTNDPLAVTIESGYKTPKITPLRSGKKSLLFDLGNSRTKSVPRKTHKDLMIEREDSLQYKSKIMTKISDLQASLYEKINEIKDLEQRLFKVEQFSNELQNECDRIRSVYNKENSELKENLATKSQELGDLTQRLVTETIALNPSLRDTLVNASVSKILSVFIETIIEGCKKIQDDLIKKYNDDKAEWDKQKQINAELIEDLQIKMKSSGEMYEAVKNELEKSKTEIFLRDEEINTLKSHEVELMKIREEFMQAQENIQQLQKDLQGYEIEKLEAINRCKELENTTTSLEAQLEEKEHVSLTTDNANSCLDDLKSENEKLQNQIKELEELIVATKEELETAKNTMNVSETLSNEFEKVRNENEALKNIFQILTNNKQSVADFYLNLKEAEDENTNLLYQKINPCFADNVKDGNEGYLAIIHEIIIDCCKSLRRTLCDEFSDCQAEFERHKNENETLINELKFQIESLNDEIKNLQVKVGASDELEKAYEELKNKMIETESAVASRDEEICSLKSLESRKGEIEGNLEKALDEISKLNSQLCFLDTSKAEMTTKCQALESEVNVLRLSTEEKENMITTLREELLKTKDESCRLEEQEKNSLDLQLELEHYIERYETLKKEMVEKNEKVVALQSVEAQAAKFQQDFIGAEEIIAKLETELNVAKNEKSEFQTKCQKLEEKISALSMEVDEKVNLLKNLETFETSSKNLNLEIENLKSVIDILNGELEEAKKENIRRENEKKNDLSCMEELREEINVLKNNIAEYESRVKELEHVQSSIETLSEEMSKIKNALTSKTEEIGYLEVQRNEIQEELNVKHATIAKLESELAAAQSDREEVEKRCVQMEEEIKENRNALIDADMFRSSNDNLKEQIEKLQHVINKLNAELEETKNNNITLENEKKNHMCLIENLENEISNLKSTVVENENKLAELEIVRDTVEGLKQEITTTKEILLTKAETIEVLKKQRNDIEKELNEKCEIITKINSDLKTAQNERKQLENRCQQLEQDFNENRTVLDDFSKVASSCDELRQQVENLQAVIKGLERELEESKDKNIKQENEKKDTLCLVENLQNEISNLKCVIVEYECKLENLEIVQESMGKIKEELATAQQSLSTKEEEISDLEAQKNEIKGDLNNKIDLIVKLETELAAAFHEQKQMQNRCLQLEKDIEENRILLNEAYQFKSLCDEFKKEIENLKATIEILNEDLEKVKDDNNTHQNERKENLSLIENLRNEIYSLNCKLTENESKLKELQLVQESFEKIKEELATTKQSLSTKMEETGVLELEKNKIQAELDQKIEGFAKLELELIAASDDQKQMQDRCMQLGKDVEEYRILLNDTKRFKESCDELGEQIEKLQATIKALNKELEEVQNENAQHKDQRKENLCFIENLQNEICNLRTTVSENESKLQKLEKIEALNEKINEELSTTKENLSTKIEDIAILEQQKREIEEEQNANRVAITKLESELLRAQDDRKEVESRCLELEKKIEENRILLDEGNKLKSLCDQLEQDIQNLRTTIADMNEQLEEAENEKKNYLCLIENLQNETSNLKSLVIDYEDKVKELEHVQGTVEALKAEIATTKESLQAKGQEISALEKQKYEIQVDLNEKVDAIVKLKSELANALNDQKQMQHRFAQLEKDIEENRILLEDAKQVQLSCDELNEQVKNLQSIIKELKEELEKLKDENIEQQKERKENLGLIENLQNKIGTLKTTAAEYESKLMKLEHVQSTMEDLKDEMATMKENFEAKTEEIEDLKKQKNEMEKELNENRKIIKTLESDLVTAREDRKELENRCAEMEENIHSKDTNLKDLEASLASFKNEKEESLKKMKTQTETLKTEIIQLKISNDGLKEKVKDLSQIINDQSKLRAEGGNLNNSLSHSKVLRSGSTRNVDLCARRLDKLEEINFNLTELVTRILTTTEFPNVEKLKFMSVRDYPSINKKVTNHLDKMASKVRDLEEANSRLDEELDSYAKHIKELKMEAVSVWKSNKTKMEALEADIRTLKEEKANLEKEREELISKVSKLDGECTKLRNAAISGVTINPSNSSNELKQIHDLKRAILMKEQKILELQDLENQNVLYKSQIKYLENALEQEKKKIRQDKEKIKKFQAEIEELKKNQKLDKKAQIDSELIDELREKGSVTGGIVQDYVDKENMRKLSKEIGILKELCRARYVEIRRLEAENITLKNMSSKNSNQMDSPLRVRSYNTRSKNIIGKELWKTDVDGKENLV